MSAAPIIRCAPGRDGFMFPSDTGRFVLYADHAAALAASEARAERYMLLCGQCAKLMEAENVRLPDGFTIEAASLRFAEELAERRERAEAAEQSLAEAVKDAERYRYLRDVWGRQIEIVGTGTCSFGVSTPSWRGDWACLDAAIDAQMQPEPESIDAMLLKGDKP